ncbi:MAG: phenylalanine--tRNA ligase subunit alpha [Candidatus Heimdallarchaeota archaeon]|nr:phenylalanine--tRNA ligase subunit alpha [Candidatus Heimdallarchaeota archaeon]
MPEDFCKRKPPGGAIQTTIVRRQETVSSSKVTQEQAKILQLLESEQQLSQEELVHQLQEDQVVIAKTILELSERGLVDSLEQTKRTLHLTKEGKKYLKEGLPERRLLAELTGQEDKVLLNELQEQSSLDPQMFNISIGWLRRKDWVEFSKKGKKTFIQAKEASPDDPDEELLTLVAKDPSQEAIPKKLRARITFLKKRGLIKVREQRTRFVKLTSHGKKLLEKGLEVQEKLETTLTPQMIITGEWREKEFKAYDPTAAVPAVYPGRMHPVMEVIRQLREIFLEMGFQEIRGPLIESEFWNFDALFQPQDHPARMMHDTFRIAEPKKAKLPGKKMVTNVAKTHEDGWKTGSTGWQYTWRRSDAQRLVLRTHTTAMTVKHLSTAFKEWEPPEKVFSIDRVYRNEKIDYKHLAEFMQVEGIVVDEQVTLKHLMGLLKVFYGKMGFDKIRLIPSYFPYTEPSMSTLIYVDKFNSWLEMGGSGIFRPEVTLPFGVKEKVLAWGQGLDRLVMLKLDLDDIREVYSTDLGWLRNTPLKF